MQDRAPLVTVLTMLIGCVGEIPAEDASVRDAQPRTDARPRDAAMRDARVSDGPSDARVDDAGRDAARPPGDDAPVFDGSSGYVEIPDDDVFSQPTWGALTVEAWIRPDSLDMPNREGSGYVHFMGKGDSGEQEWVSRMYQQGNTEGRENRISFYAFNLEGGLGAGSYFQDAITPREWIHYTGAMDDTLTYIHRDGAERDSDPLSGYSIVPRNGAAPVRIGTRDQRSFFAGSIARVAIYGARLDATQIQRHVDAVASGTYDEVVLAEPSLVAYYPLDETDGDVARDLAGGRDGRYVGGVAVGGTRWLGP